MGSDNIPHHHQPGKIHSSSILLLQERFKELERVKEMRQGRDLLMRRLWESERYNTTSDTTTSPSVSDHHDYDHGGDDDDDDQTSKSLWFRSEILLIPQPTRARHPNCHLQQQQQKISLSLRPISQMNMKKKKKKTCLMLSPPLISHPNESDVDTSLHL